MRTVEVKYTRIVIVLFCIPLVLFGQVLVRPSGHNLNYFDYRAIQEGKVQPYLSYHQSYEWRQFIPKGGDDLLQSQLGSRLRKNRLKIYPAIDGTVYLNGGHINRNGGVLDIAPVVNVVSRYKIPPLGRYNIIFWTRIEKHSVVSQEKISDLSYDFSWQKEIGHRAYPGNDSSWIEYTLGDGGIFLSYPNGEITFAQSNPVWGSGYTGQLWLSEKVPSFVFLGFQHRFSDQWSFAYFHGRLNSTFRDSTFLSLYPMKSGIPMIKKYIVAHRLEFRPQNSMSIGFGESVIYGGRNLEMAYALPVLFYWSTQHDLSDSDNLQIFLDFQFIRKGFGRLYGSLYLDEWDLVDTFNRDESRNWAAYQVGFVYALPFLSTWNSLFRIETTHLTPYVYVHESKLSTFQHHGHYLGFWSGPNSDNLFLAIEGSPIAGWWLQLYSQRTRRGEVNEITIEHQYSSEKIPFLYPHEDNPETRTLLGFRGEFLVYSFLRLSFDAFWDLWVQNGNQTKSQKIDGIIRLSVGL